MPQADNAGIDSLELGSTVEYNGRMQRIIRIITHSLSLFENDEGETQIADESYVEMRDMEGKIDFHILQCDLRKYEGQPSPIKAPDPIPQLRRE